MGAADGGAADPRAGGAGHRAARHLDECKDPIGSLCGAGAPQVQGTSGCLELLGRYGRR